MYIYLFVGELLYSITSTVLFLKHNRGVPHLILSTARDTLSRFGFFLKYYIICGTVYIYI